MQPVYLAMFLSKMESRFGLGVTPSWEVAMPGLALGPSDSPEPLTLTLTLRCFLSSHFKLYFFCLETFLILFKN